MLELTDFRGYESARLEFPPGVTVLVGGNGAGKTSLLEAVGWVATGGSFRGASDATMVRVGCEQAILRVGIATGERHQDVAVELRSAGRSRVLVNGQPLRRTRDLLGVLRVTVFAPDDLELVKGGPSGRRTYLDDLLVSLSPRYEGTRADYERIVRQRNALLKSGRWNAETVSTLDVFDEQLTSAGTTLVQGRLRLVERLRPFVQDAYRMLAGGGAVLDLEYEADWFTGILTQDQLAEQLREHLAARRSQERQRGVTLVGPHRDEVRLTIDGLDARTRSSQGEQRTVALALRLAAHRLCIEVTDEEPVLLLDDVLSELDGDRAAALLEQLFAEQTLLTTAGVLPEIVRPARVVRVRDGHFDVKDTTP